MTRLDEGSFRRDLFYRLNVFPVHVPALRERKDDIAVLVEYLVERYAKRSGKRITSTSRATLELLQSYNWPGNIRELQNVIERAVILCEGDTLSVDEKWLRRDTKTTGGGAQHGTLAEGEQAFARREREAIEAALTETRGRISGPDGAAALLGIPRQTLDSKIASLGIDKYHFKQHRKN
jgi:formate hydrogenlyase transcriptional activator